MTMPGPKIPPDPPEPMDRPVARIRAKGTMSTIHSGMDSRPWWVRHCCTQP